MSWLPYKEIVFIPRNSVYELVWCEYYTRLHTAIELSYQIRVFEASEFIASEFFYKKGKHLIDSSWKVTPMWARREIENEVGLLEKEHILYEKWLGSPYTIKYKKEF